MRRSAPRPFLVRVAAAMAVGLWAFAAGAADESRSAAPGAGATRLLS